MKLSLVVLAAGKQEGKVLEIKVPQFVIGRDPECHLRPTSPMISKKHCALIQKDGKVYIKDFGSTNGSYVNDQPVQNAAVQLKNGDTLKIGPLLFSVRLEAGAATPAAQPAPAPQAAAAKTAPAAPQLGQPAAKPVQAAKPGQPAKVAATAGPSSPPPADSKPDSDEDIAAMLLSGADDETVSDGPSAADIPQGTTVFEMPAPGAAKPGEDADKPKEPAKEKESNSAVAAAILEKLRKRPRSGNA
jgi:pSer/pThr/pTyr-binding forkhead associated (FHA) protein